MNELTYNGHCRCGQAAFAIKGTPLMRGYCHCTICQSFNQAPFADITLYRTRDVMMPKEGLIDYKSYAFPPILKRGKCVSCGGAAIEYIKLPLLNITIIPTANIHDSALVPEPSMHIFYDTRQRDIDDELPKYSGYFSSQVAFMKQLVARLGSGD